MKRAALLALMSILFSLSVPADDLKTETGTSTAVKPETPRAKAETIQKAEIKKPKQPEKLVTYSGFLVVVARTNQPGKLLNLRKPLDPIHDAENLRFDMRTGRPNGFRLFSIDF
jgi:hypothetical protein